MKDFAVSAHTTAGTKVLQRQRVAKRVQAKTAQPSLLLPGLFFLLIVSIFFYVWTRVHMKSPRPCGRRKPSLALTMNAH